MTAVDCRCAIIELVAELFLPENQNRWMLTSHFVLEGDWPSLAMEKGNEQEVYRLLLRLKRGN